MCKHTLAGGSAAGCTHCWACTDRPRLSTYMPPKFRELLLLSRLFTSKMGAIQHVAHRLVSGPSKNTEYVEWLCKF